MTGSEEVQPSAAPATRVRALTPERLAELSRATRQQLVRALLVERGVRVTRLQPRGEADDLYVSLSAVWRSRQGRVRVIYRSVDEADVASLAEVAAAEDLAEAVLIEAAPHEGDGVVGGGRVQLIGAEALAAGNIGWADQLEREQFVERGHRRVLLSSGRGGGELRLERVANHRRPLEKGTGGLRQ